MIFSPATGITAFGVSTGRLVIVFRNASPKSKDQGGFIVWVRTYDDFKRSKPGASIA